MIYFTADTHFFHENVIRHSKRPFASLEEMHETLIANWNAIVTKTDRVYHLGDFAISWGSKSKVGIAEIFGRLRGQKFLVKGNHDRKECVNLPWVGVFAAHEIKVDMGAIHKQRIVLSHYAMRTWNQMHRGAWMLHGHSHGSLPDVGGLTMDVGVDCWNYTPVSLTSIASAMTERSIITYDHHTVHMADFDGHDNTGTTA